MQARFIVENGFIALKRGFWWINLKVMGVAMDFLVANVRLEAGMRLLNGDGTRQFVRNFPTYCYSTISYRIKCVPNAYGALLEYIFFARDGMARITPRIASAAHAKGVEVCRWSSIWYTCIGIPLEYLGIPEA
jgi:hypothetical protein